MHLKFVILRYEIYSDTKLRYTWWHTLRNGLNIDLVMPGSRITLFRVCRRDWGASCVIEFDPRKGSWRIILFRGQGFRRLTISNLNTLVYHVKPFDCSRYPKIWIPKRYTLYSPHSLSIIVFNYIKNMN